MFNYKRKITILCSMIQHNWYVDILRIVFGNGKSHKIEKTCLKPTE